MIRMTWSLFSKRKHHHGNPGWSREPAGDTRRLAAIGGRTPWCGGRQARAPAASPQQKLSVPDRLHVLDHFHAEAGQAVHALGSGQHPHLAYAEVGQDLRTGAEGTQVLALLAAPAEFFLVLGAG